MSEKPKRRFWQLHLSTAVLLMLVAGGLLALNTKQSHCRLNAEWNAFVNGWPFVYRFELTDLAPENELESIPYLWDYEAIKTLNLILDVVIASVILVSVGSLCEWLIRRREANRQ